MKSNPLLVIGLVIIILIIGIIVWRISLPEEKPIQSSPTVPLSEKPRQPGTPEKPAGESQSVLDRIEAAIRAKLKK